MLLLAPLGLCIDHGVTGSYSKSEVPASEMWDTLDLRRVDFRYRGSVFRYFVRLEVAFLDNVRNNGHI